MLWKWVRVSGVDGSKGRRSHRETVGQAASNIYIVGKRTERFRIDLMRGEAVCIRRAFRIESKREPYYILFLVISAIIVVDWLLDKMRMRPSLRRWWTIEMTRRSWYRSGQSNVTNRKRKLAVMAYSNWLQVYIILSMHHSSASPHSASCLSHLASQQFYAKHFILPTKEIQIIMH